MTAKEKRDHEMLMKELAKKNELAKFAEDHGVNLDEVAMNEWYQLNEILGYQWAMFYVLLGSRETGKSFTAMDFCLSQWKNKNVPFVWIRISAVSTQKLLANKAMKFVDPELYRKYDLDLTTKGMDVYDHGKLMCKVLSLTDCSKEKGVSMYDSEYNGWYNCVFDEFQREPGEVKRFSIRDALTTTLENCFRSRKHKVRVIMICNVLEKCNELLADCFNFIPEEFGIYKLVKNKKTLMRMLQELEDAKNADERQIIYNKYKDIDFGKRAVIHYIPPTDGYNVRRRGTLADQLNGSSSNFTNKIDRDRTMLYKGKLNKPMAIIKFTNSPDDWFTLWDGNVIARYNKEKVKVIVAMRPYINEVYAPDLRDSVIARYHAKAILYKNLITQAKFTDALEKLKANG